MSHTDTDDDILILDDNVIQPEQSTSDTTVSKEGTKQTDESEIIDFTFDDTASTQETALENPSPSGENPVATENALGDSEGDDMTFDFADKIDSPVVAPQEQNSPLVTSGSDEPLEQTVDTPEVNTVPPNEALKSEEAQLNVTDLKGALNAFTNQVKTIKDQNTLSITQHQEGIELLKGEITSRQNEIKDLQSRIRLLENDNKEIDAKVLLLQGSRVTNSHNKTRKKAA